MFFPASAKQEWFSKKCLLLAFFFSFSFNHIVLTKYHFVLGQASFYFIALALLTSHFSIPRRSLLFIAIFLAYCLGSAAFFCYEGEGLCSARPYTAVISIIFVFLTVQYVAYLVEQTPIFEISIEKYLIYGAWALVLLAIPDMVVIAKGGMINSLPYGLEFLSPFGLSPYSFNRLRGFTQEPSYLGMVIATLYPICFIRLNEKFTLEKALLVIGLWTCLGFSVSRTGLLTCFILTLAILMMWPRRLLATFLLLAALVLAWRNFPVLRENTFLSLAWLPLFKQSGIDGSTLVRSAHIFASLNAWKANLFFGLGLGQSGFVLPQFYPDWFLPDSLEYRVWAPKSAFGGTPSLSFLPKLLAEIGLFSLLILFAWFAPLFKALKNALKAMPSCKKYIFAFAGFLMSSFGVEGYLYLPAWLIFGVIIGLLRIPDHKIGHQHSE